MVQWCSGYGHGCGVMVQVVVQVMVTVFSSTFTPQFKLLTQLLFLALPQGPWHEQQQALGITACIAL